MHWQVHANSHLVSPYDHISSEPAFYQPQQKPKEPTVEARKLEYDCPLIPKLRKEGKSPYHPKFIFQPCRVYRTMAPIDVKTLLIPHGLDAWDSMSRLAESKLPAFKPWRTNGAWSPRSGAAAEPRSVIAINLMIHLSDHFYSSCLLGVVTVMLLFLLLCLLLLLTVCALLVITVLSLLALVIFFVIFFSPLLLLYIALSSLSMSLSLLAFLSTYILI